MFASKNFDGTMTFFTAGADKNNLWFLKTGSQDGLVKSGPFFTSAIISLKI